MAEVKIESITGTREGTRILCLTGPFTLEGVFAFQSIADSLNETVVIIDLTDVPYMDSCALGAIMGLHRPSQLHERQYAVVGACERIRTMFHVARVDDILVTYATLEEAQQKLDFKAAGN
jgi:anti-anti-sigma factor